MKSIKIIGFLTVFLSLSVLLFPLAPHTFAGSYNEHRPVCPGPGNAGNVVCHSRVVTDHKGNPDTTQAPAGYGPAQFLGAYALGNGQAAAPGIIAIVDAYDHPSVYADLNTYSAAFNIPQLPVCTGPISASAVPCFQKLNQRGGTTVPQANAGWALEISLDVETAHAVCQNCRILLVEADSNSFANLMTAVDQARFQGAKIISNSYGASEFSGETSYDSHFTASGTAYLFSSGDSGYGAQYPAASPLVTGAGGTTLTLSGNSYVSESAWNGAGSGCSAFEPKPSFQTDPGCAGRTVSDVSAVADPNTGAAVYDSFRYQGRKGWFKVGGTSLAAPLIAGVYGLAGNIPSNTAANSYPYSHRSGLRDITGGSNGTCGGSYLCTALSGYDGPTGLGSPNGIAAF